LRSMDVNAEAGIPEWAVSASYYARYFAVYALLQKIGVKCEIHDCTIALFEYLFGDSVPKQLIRELQQSKEYRIEAQYYTQEIKVDLDRMINETKNFVLEIEKIIDSLDTERIAQLQNRLKGLKA
ncbi:MAG TPA: HEPN domain-containing protein, partial [Candidatus Hodarchaeales archaeon]|nr:HEPN domain-containing protein [Candidatus Hodarchaeales archaeon]